MTKHCDDECKEDHFNQHGNILIADQFNNRVIEVNKRGEIVWFYGLGPTNFTTFSAIGTNDAERVGKKTLITCTGTPGGIVPQAPTTVIDSRVILVNKHKKIVWQYGQFGVTGTGPNLLNFPVQATFVPHKCKDNCHCHHLHGNVLITDQSNNRVIEVDEKKNIVWQYPGTNTTPADQLNAPNSAQKLKHKHVLIADQSNNRAIEVNKHDVIIRTFTASGTLGACAFASRLSNGNTLLTDAGNNRIVEVDHNDNIVWQYKTNTAFFSIPNPGPSRGLRLKNGDTLIADQFNNRVIKINETTNILDDYGLALQGGSGPVGPNSGYNTFTTQLGLYAPYDAKVIGDYTGLTRP